METLVKNYSKNFSFTDAEGSKVMIELSIDNGKLSICGNMKNSGGQIVDQIKPANDGQRKLKNLWNQYHLNDMQAGTPSQMGITNGLSYESALKALICYTGGENGEWIGEEKQKEQIELWDKFNKVTHNLGYTDLLPILNLKNLASLATLAAASGKSLKNEIEYFLFGETSLYDKHPETGKPYRYGTAWLKMSLPEGIIDTIEEIIEEINGETFEGSPYEKQANDFLKSINAEMKAVFINHDKHFDDDKESRDIYHISFTRKDKYPLKLTFGQSLKDSGFYYTKGVQKIDIDRAWVNDSKSTLVSKLKRKDWDYLHNGKSDKIHYPIAPSAYDVLACITKNDPGDFEDFCSNFGYETDSRKAKKVFKRVKEEWKKVKGFFSIPELEQLNEIN